MLTKFSTPPGKMSRAHMLYNDTAINKISNITWKEKWQEEKVFRLEKGQGVTIEGKVKDTSRISITEATSGKISHQYTVMNLEFSRAYKRSFDDFGVEIEPWKPATKKVNTGYLMSSYKTVQLETSVITLEDLLVLVHLPEFDGHLPKLQPNTIPVFCNNNSLGKIELRSGETVRLKTKGDGPYVEYIARLDEGHVSASECASDSRASWTDKIMSMKGQGEKRMPKYGVATYKSRKQCANNTSAQTEFDLALAAKNDRKKSGNCSERDLEMQRNSELKAKRASKVLEANKKRKINPLFEDDLFGFTESDSESRQDRTLKRSPCKKKSSSKQNSGDSTSSPFEVNSSFNNRGSPFKNNSPLKSNLKIPNSPSGIKKTVKFEGTDDEAYGSSQEPGAAKEIDCGVDNERATQKQSPFKHFIKNNVASLSPKKKKRLDRRFSALPTNTVQSDDTMSEDEAEGGPHLPRALSTEASSSTVRVNREEKQLFTVVRNVKHKYACLEDGETQQFFDDVEFALDGLRQDLSLAARCSSALELATQCSTSSFRANLRAHGFIAKIFDCLQDAPTNETLALCSSCVFYMITRDQLSVDFDQSILELLLKLLCIDKHHSKSKLVNVKKNLHAEMVKKTRQILSRLPESHTMFLDMENLSSTSLARESLLSLKSQRTGEWFKEEMRKLGGLDYIVDLVLTSVVDIKDNSEELGKNEKGIDSIKRCLKLIENVTLQNQENQIYLVSCRKTSFVIALSRLLKVCMHGIIKDCLGIGSPFFPVILDCMKTILRVFLNLTHDNGGESETIGQQDGLISTLLLCVLQVPQFVSAEDQFDILVLALGLLINLMEHSKQNIASLIVVKTTLSYEDSQNSKHCEESKQIPRQEVSAVEALVNLFQLREQAARDNEAMNCDLPNGRNDELKLTQDGLGWVCGEDIEEPDVLKNPTSDEEKKEEKSLEDEIAEALKKAGKHMEDSMVASYVALLLGCIAKDNNANQNLIRQLLPENNFDVLINTLKTFLGFMKLTSGTTGQAIEKIIDVLKNC